VFPVHIQYAQEARPYAMLTFATTLTLCAVLWIMRHPAEACEPMIRRPFDLKQSSANGMGWSHLLPWMTATVAISFTLWLHNTAVLYIFTLSLILLAWFILELRSNRTFLGNFMAVAAIAILLWVPNLIFLIHHTVNASLPIPKPTALSIVNTVVWLLLGTSISWTASVSTLLKMVVFVFLIALAAAGLLNIRRHSGPYVSLLILGSIFGPILMEFLISFTFRPIFLARTLVYVSVPFSLAIAAGIMTLRDSRKRALVVIILSLIFLKWTYTYYANYQKEPWDKIAQSVAQQAKQDVVLFVPNNIELPFSYYAKSISNANLQIVPLPFPLSHFLHPALDPERLGSDSLKAIQIRPSDIPVINNAIAKKSPVWLITRRADLFDQDGIVFNILMRQRDLISTWHFEDISVFKFN
jgi:mannosyltransferase